MQKRPPYQLVADIGSIALVLFVILAYRFLPGRVPEWAFGIAYGVSVTVLVSVLTEIVLLLRDYRAGLLYPMRNASLFIFLLSVVGLPLYLIYLFVSGQPPGASTLLLVPVLLAFATRNLFRVRIDALSVLAKTGFRGPTEVPLFRIDEVRETDARIEITADGYRPIYLLRSFFFPRHWAAIREKIAGLGN